jgi:TnpA family transposase
MPVQFLTAGQRADYGRYVAEPTEVELNRYFYLDDTDHQQLSGKRGEHNRLGFAVQLTTVRYLGRFLDDTTQAPPNVLSILSKQLGLADTNCLLDYHDQRQRLRHIEEICQQYGYREINDPFVGYQLTRWLYAQCWTGTDRPIVLFERATSWLLAHKVLLPGASTLERFIAKLRQRVEQRLWHLLGQGISKESQRKLEALLSVPEGNRRSWFDQLRTGPTNISGPSLVRALERLETVRGQGITFPPAGSIPPSRIAALARFASRAKATAISRLPKARRLATLAAFMRTLEASAQDDALDILVGLLREIFSNAKKADQKARLRSLRDLDAAAITLAKVCALLLDQSLNDNEVRTKIFAQFPRESLEQKLQDTYALVRPPDDVFYHELQERHRRVRLFLPKLLQHIHFVAAPAGEHTVAALTYLRQHHHKRQFDNTVPLDVINKAWSRYVILDLEKKTVDPRAYTFCVLDQLRIALKRRDVFVTPSWRYADPRSGLLSGVEWETARPIICRTLGLDSNPKPVLEELTRELDRTYRAVIARVPNNPAVRFEGDPDKEELILSPLDKIEEPDSLITLRKAVAERMPRVDLPEILLEIAVRTGFTDAFTHVSEQSARATGLTTTLCAVLLSEACNTGMEPFVRNDVTELRRDRLTWVSQNYLRDDTLVAANAKLVAAQNSLALAQVWGGGEVASADGMRFVVPVKTVHAGPNPKYFGVGRGVTYYNLVSNQFTGLHAITVPGTLRDSLVLLSVVLEQETELRPTQIMTDTGAYSDIVFGLFRLLGYRFSPRLADVGGTRFWRIDSDADYGSFNHIARQKVNLELIAQHWDDLLRLAGSLKLGKISPASIMRTLQIADHPTRLAQALAEFGRIDKTLHMLTYIDDEDKRRDTLIQLNRGESRHSLAREVFHGKRGELRQRYREGQEDQLGSLGLVTNVIILWNTIYMEAILKQLRKEGHQVLDADVARLSPLIYGHIHMLGRYSFAMPEAVARGELRTLRNPKEDA